MKSNRLLDSGMCYCLSQRNSFLSIAILTGLHFLMKILLCHFKTCLDERSVELKRQIYTVYINKLRDKKYESILVINTFTD